MYFANQNLTSMKNIITLCLVLLSLSATAYDFSLQCSSGQILCYNILSGTDHTVEVTYGEFVYGHIDIPETVSYEGETYTVVKIGERAFEGRAVHGVTIPCKITEIGTRAFSESGINEPLHIPDNVTKLGDYAFSECISMTGPLVLSSSLTEIGDHCFASCHEVTGTLSIPQNVTKIGSHAFYSCYGLTGDLVIPNSVTEIGSSAFCGCHGMLGPLVLGNHVETIGNSAFAGCGGLSGALIFPETLKSIGSYAFGFCRGFTGDLVIPDSVEVINSHAFENCSGFTGNLILGKSLKIIGEDAFWACSINGSLTIPDSVLEIGKTAFCSTRLDGVLTIGSSVSTIGECAFDGCNRFAEVNFRSLLPPQMGYAVFYMPQNCPCHIPCDADLSAYRAVLYQYFENISNGDFLSGSLSVETNDSNGGEANIVVSPSCANAGQVILQAEPADGFVFSCWERFDNQNDEWTSVSENPEYQFILEGYVRIRACFTQIQQIEEQIAETLSVFPNPSCGKITICCNGIVMVYNVLGQIIGRYEVDESLNLTLKEGLYFLKCGNEIQKVIVK